MDKILLDVDIYLIESTVACCPSVCHMIELIDREQIPMHCFHNYVKVHNVRNLINKLSLIEHYRKCSAYHLYLHTKINVDDVAKYFHKGISSWMQIKVFETAGIQD